MGMFSRQKEGRHQPFAVITETIGTSYGTTPREDSRVDIKKAKILNTLRSRNTMIQSARDLQTYVVKEAASANDAERFAELSLMVHPDKCPYLEANQAFIKLNKALKDLQDLVKLELKAMHEAAQGISMEGDDVLLA
ncbi:hypothetical protein L2E82_11452 [Cichorium intybus]|uniref:Uncharacterized protein n=1 Tax=Cichorium intybus TaxID=13427 RepID=A0ACB9GFC1_CICIN|nr:hypothetical protein L2E82_11452 [Cichorium intybus]